MPVSGKLKHPHNAGAVCLIGLGRLGSSLHAALTASGNAPVEVVGRTKKNAARGVPVVGLEQARLDATVIWLCVPDDEIAGVVKAIVAKRPSLHGQTMVHSSGVYSSAILSDAARAGAKVASVHPLMTFPVRKPVALAGVPFAVEATGAVALRLEKLVRQMGGQPFRLPAAGKALYHAAAVMASPLLVSLAAAARETVMRAGLSGEQADALLEPIMTATVKNFFRDGAAHSFSGPFARGDAKTVSLHLEALQPHPFQQAVYAALALHAMHVLPVVNRRALRKLLAAAETT